MVTKLSSVEGFLKHFKNSDNIEEVFTNECSYWFATILFRRFIRSGATIMYDNSVNYFGVKINNRVYDITGDITNKYSWIPWDSVTDERGRQEITSKYIMF